MKKIEKLIIFLMVAVFAFGCANNKNESANVESESSVVESIETTMIEDESIDDMVDYDSYETMEEEFMLSRTDLNVLYDSSTNLDVYDAKGNITWTNSNNEVVSLEENENSVMVIGTKPGEAIITATAENGEGSCNVKVLSRGLYLKDDRGNVGAYSSGTYNLGKKHNYTAFYDGAEISPETLKWGSLDESVATVNDGVVDMVGTGITYIYAEDGDGNIAYSSVWVSDTDDEYEYETKMPEKGLFFMDMFTAYEEYILESYENVGENFSIGEVYDDNVKIDAGTLSWSAEPVKGNPFVVNDAETNAEEVAINYTGEAGMGFLVATNPATGHTFRYLIKVYDPRN